MSSATLFLTVPFDDEDAWESFTLLHGMAHQRVYLAMLSSDLVPDFFPLFDFPRDGNEGYLLDHYRTHQSQAALLGLGSVPDISASDLSDIGQFNNWMQLHAAIHAEENRALRIP